MCLRWCYMYVMWPVQIIVWHETVGFWCHIQCTWDWVMSTMGCPSFFSPNFLLIFNCWHLITCRDVVKLTAQFVARNGRQFLTNLMNREQRNYQFDFLRPQHSLFNYFTKLVEQYTKVSRIFKIFFPHHLPCFNLNQNWIVFFIHILFSDDLLF